MRLLLGAFGDPGHAFPMIALGARLAAHGHAVTLQTWRRWAPDVRAAGMAFAPAPEYPVFPTRERPLRPYEAVVPATRDTLPLVRTLRPDAVVADILTLAPALAAELEGVPVATLIPHVYPVGAPGAPPYASGARPPRSRLGRRAWALTSPLVRRGLQRGRRELNGARARVGLGPVDRLHGGISRRLCLVATLPQLEYPRAWPPGTQVVGPLLWEPPFGEVALPRGDAPLALVAPSTSQDPEHRLLHAALRGLGDLPIRVLATWNGRLPSRPLPEVPANTRMVEWVSYARTMPRCALVICHGGHGTLARALASGAAILACPAAGDMAENAARVDWAGVGVRLPWRWLSPATLRLAVRRALDDPGLARRAAQLAHWTTVHDGAERAAGLVEAFAARGVR